MKLIEWLCDKMNEELDDAHCYVQKALAVKDEYRSLADTLYKLSTEEVGHMQALHAETAAIIAEYRRTEGEPPAAMLAVYDYLHGKYMEKARDVRIEQELYRSK